MKAMDICFSSTSFTLQQTIYQQIYGTPTSFPLSPIIANAVMEKLERRACNSFHSPLCIWFCSVDDVHTRYYGTNLHWRIPSIFEYHLQYHQVYKRRRTWRFFCFPGFAGYTHSRRIAKNHSIQKTNAYRQIPIFFLPLSFQQKLSIHRTLFSRAENIINEYKLKKDDIRTINNTLISNGFPKFHIKRRHARSESQFQQTKIMTAVPCVKNLIEPIKRVLQQLGVGAAMKRVCVMPDIFCETINKVQPKKVGPCLSNILWLR